MGQKCLNKLYSGGYMKKIDSINQIKNKIKDIIKNRLNSDVTDGFLNELLNKCGDLTEEQIIKMIDDFTLKYKYPTFTLANILEYKPIRERGSNLIYISCKQYTDSKTGELIPYSELFKGYQDNFTAFVNSNKKYQSKEWDEHSVSFNAYINPKNLDINALTKIKEIEMLTNSICIADFLLHNENDNKKID